jgi:hypothetical protein
MYRIPDSQMTKTRRPARLGSRASVTPQPAPGRRVFRLLHSTGDILITDRSEALARLHHLPGAKLFVLAA